MENKQTAVPIHFLAGGEVAAEAPPALQSRLSQRQALPLWCGFPGQSIL
ncbi:MAG: hypothetical protein WBR26_14855 [Candidatus Acidiferrum sp.]